MPAGRPPTFTPEKIAAVVKLLDQYTANTEIPIVAEFAYQNNIRKATLYEIPEFAYSVKKMIEKKEAQLEKLALDNETTTNVTMAIFSLKQLGWSDKQERLLKTIDDEGNETGFKLVAPPDAST